MGNTALEINAERSALPSLLLQKYGCYAACGYYLIKSRFELGIFWCFIFSDRPKNKDFIMILRERPKAEHRATLG